MPAPLRRLALLAVRAPRRGRRAKAHRAFALGVAASLLLTGCLPIVSLPAADGANDPGCAEVSVRLPDSIDALPRRETDAQATGAWGDPVAVILRCGVDVPGPSTLPCIEIPGTGVFWLRDDSEAPHYLFTSYGRDPAVAVEIDSDLIAPGIALDELSSAVVFAPGNGRECLDLEDTVTGAELLPDDEPSAAPPEE